MKYPTISILLILLLTGCRDDNLPPDAKCSSYPVTGNTATLFEFDAGNSLDDNNLSESLRYRWDFNDDSVWDTEFRGESATSHYFNTPGAWKVKVEVADFDGLSDTASATVTVFGRNTDIDTLVDPRDGQSYRIVRIKDSWWMSENLRYGVTIDKGIEQKDNDTVEMYRWAPYPFQDTLGGTYRWLEAMNYQLDSIRGICPPGWHIPARAEWESLVNDMPFLYAGRYYGRNGLSEMNLHISNHLFKYLQDISFTSSIGGFWSSGYRREEYLIYPGMFRFDYFIGTGARFGFLDQAGPENSTLYVQYFTVRCKKD